tara:strand:- start:7409 stop:7888 length:480 start_codon:yes stop_codon:yes gene_type:complete
MKKTYKKYLFEFMFLINDHPIVGRNFPINNFNKESLHSYEIKESIDSIVEIIRKYFKKRSFEYLYRYHNYYNTNDNLNCENVYENEDIFKFQIKYKGDVVSSKIFSGNDYPPKVRYDVDIRKIIPLIVEELQVSLSEKTYSQKYLEYDLTDIFNNKVNK